MVRRLLFASLSSLAPACGRASELPAATGWEGVVVDREARESPVQGPELEGSVSHYRLRSLEFRSGVCEGYDLTPDRTTLDEASLVRFLERRNYTVHLEHQPVDPKKPPLSFAFMSGRGITEPIALRIAVLPSTDAAGRALHDALRQRGAGAWGLHRSNVAVLGPMGTTAEAIALVARTQLACWGTPTFADSEGSAVVPGGYTEP